MEGEYPSLDILNIKDPITAQQVRDMLKDKPVGFGFEVTVVDMTEDQMRATAKEYPDYILGLQPPPRPIPAPGALYANFIGGGTI